jgi:hypothetical protein
MGRCHPTHMACAGMAQAFTCTGVGEGRVQRAAGVIGLPDAACSRACVTHRNARLEIRQIPSGRPVRNGRVSVDARCLDGRLVLGWLVDIDDLWRGRIEQVVIW